jgi:hypothetical protein
VRVHRSLATVQVAVVDAAVKRGMLALRPQNIFVLGGKVKCMHAGDSSHHSYKGYDIPCRCWSQVDRLEQARCRMLERWRQPPGKWDVLSRRDLESKSSRMVMAACLQGLMWCCAACNAGRGATSGSLYEEAAAAAWAGADSIAEEIPLLQPPLVMAQGTNAVLNPSQGVVPMQHITAATRAVSPAEQQAAERPAPAVQLPQQGRQGNSDGNERVTQLSLGRDQGCALGSYAAAATAKEDDFLVSWGVGVPSTGLVRIGCVRQ